MSAFTIVAHVASEGPFESNEASVLVLKARLEDEGIECFLQGQLRGPTVLKIRSIDFEKARPVLVETGFYQKEYIPPDPFFLKFDSATKNISFLKNFSLGLRLLIFLILFAGIITAVMCFTLTKK